MNRFTIDADFISLAGLNDNLDLFLNVLMIFAQDNEFRLCLDSSKVAFDRYYKIALENESIRIWLNFLLGHNRSSKNIDFILIKKKCYLDNKQIYIDICNNSCSKMKRIIVSDKQSYSGLMKTLTKHEINLLDGYEAKKLLNTQFILQISTGDNSPNIIGNNNITNK